MDMPAPSHQIRCLRPTLQRAVLRARIAVRERIRIFAHDGTVSPTRRKNISDCSREAAREYSPRRKPWVPAENESAPARRKIAPARRAGWPTQAGFWLEWGSLELNRVFLLLF